MRLFFLYLIAFGCLTSCSKDPLTVQDQILLGEYDGNFAILSEESTLIEQEDFVVEYGIDYLILDKEAFNAGMLDVGKYVAKVQVVDVDDSPIFMRKILTVEDQGSTVRVTTESVFPGEIYSKLDIRSDRDLGSYVIVRTESIPVFVQAKNFPFKPTSFVEKFKYNEIDFNVEYNEDSLQFYATTMPSGATRYGFKIVDLKLSGQYNIEMKGKVRAGIKLDKLIPNPIPLSPIPPPSTLPIAIFIDPVIELYGSMKGFYNTATYQYSTTPFDVQFWLDTDGNFIDYESVLPKGLPSVTFSEVEPYDFGGSLEFDVFAGANVYVSVAVPVREAHLIKVGTKVGAFTNVKIEKNNTFDVPSSNYTGRVRAGIKQQLFYSQSLTPPGTLIFDWFSIGLDYKTPSFFDPLIDESIPSDFSGNCVKINRINFNRVLGTMTIDVEANTVPSDRFIAYINDSLLVTSNGDPQYFEYNMVNSIVSAVPIGIENSIAIMDTAQNGCFFQDIFASTGDLTPGDCEPSFIDPRNGQKYCTVQIGSQVWIRSNLNWGGLGDDIGITPPFGGDNIIEAFAGQLYTFDQVFDGDQPNPPGSTGIVQGICPSGYHIPSYEDFKTLEDFLITSNNLEGKSNKFSELHRLLKMNDRYFWPSAELPTTSQFNAVSAGEAYPWLINNNPYGHQFDHAYFWTSSIRRDQYNRKDYPVVYQIISGDSDQVGVGGIRPVLTTKDIAYSCRCIQD